MEGCRSFGRQFGVNVAHFFSPWTFIQGQFAVPLMSVFCETNFLQKVVVLHVSLKEDTDTHTHIHTDAK